MTRRRGLALTVNGQFNWNGGTLGSGGSLAVTANGVMNLEAAVTLFGALINQGTINWLAGNVTIYTNTAAGQTGTIVNQAGALFDIQSDQSMNSGGAQLAVFHNAGLLRKRVTSGSSTVNLSMDNSGIVHALTGTIIFTAGANLGAPSNR